MRKKTALPWLWLSVVVIILDQLLKYWVVSHFQYHQLWPLLSFLNLTLAFNPGAAFSFLGSASGWQIYFFSAISLLIAILFIVWLAQIPRGYHWRGLALSLIIGGAIGNFIDRVRLGYVIDFVDFHLRGWHFATFNLADSAICVGAFFLILSLLFASESRP
ncbi:MAG: signal peptidase II [Coxiella sp. RIFCSPHIGHO2_12_FULL_42_15]|nr:MAG: signal peptidase II [Coxiella sp. RIFCSPHIGHO2_12_FULL_42_15]